MRNGNGNENGKYLMTTEEREEALKWLYENQDTWENDYHIPGGHKWLIPEEEVIRSVPSYVIKWVEGQKMASIKAEKMYKTMSAMGLTSGEEKEYGTADLSGADEVIDFD